MNKQADGNIQSLMGRGAVRAPAVSDLINRLRGYLKMRSLQVVAGMEGTSSHLAPMKQWGLVLETAASFSGWRKGEFLKGKFLALPCPLTHPLPGGTAFLHDSAIPPLPSMIPGPLRGGDKPARLKNDKTPARHQGLAIETLDQESAVLQ